MAVTVAAVLPAQKEMVNWFVQCHEFAQSHRPAGAPVISSHHFMFYMFFVPCIVKQLRNINRQNAHSFILMF